MSKVARQMPNLRSLILPLAILAGIAGYFGYVAIPALDNTHRAVLEAVSVAQPLLIFAMLFITFCRVRLRELRPAKWHWPMLLMQVGVFVAGAAVINLCSSLNVAGAAFNDIAESFLICMICPTATAAAVVTYKLGGNTATLTAYTILINFAVSLVVPLTVPLLHTAVHVDAPAVFPTAPFLNYSLYIIIKVFPLLIGPLVLAVVARKLCPRFTSMVAAVPDLAFYLWAISLMLAIAVSVKELVNSRASLFLIVGIAVASAIACTLQFAFGRMVGRRYNDPVSAAQACGQKNTVLAIWLGYSFFSPVTAIAGGFYSIWHNVYNSWQLARRKNEDN